MQRRRLRGPRLSCLGGRAESAAAHPAGLRTQKALRGWHQAAQEACNVPVVHGSATANAATRAVGWRLWRKGGDPRGRGGANGGGWARAGGACGGAAAQVGRVPRPRRRPALPRSAVSRHGLRVQGCAGGRAADALFVWRSVPSAPPVVPSQSNPVRCGREGPVWGCRKPAPSSRERGQRHSPIW